VTAPVPSAAPVRRYRSPMSGLDRPERLPVICGVRIFSLRSIEVGINTGR
jgi:hypothetical protein